MRLLKPYRQRPASMIELENGAMAGTAEAARQRWFRHFCSTLKARSTNLAELQQQAWAGEQRAFCEQAITKQIYVAAAPPLSFIHGRFATKKVAKAAGTDGLVGEVYRAAYEPMARHVWPVMAKSAWALSFPLSLRGGHLLELWKGKGAMHLCDSHREINIKDLNMKDLSLWWRSLIKPAIDEYAGDQAFGGMHGRGTDIIAQAARQHWRYLKHAGMSGAQLYAVLRVVFASALRELAFARERSDETVANKT